MNIRRLITLTALILTLTACTPASGQFSAPMPGYAQPDLGLTAAVAQAAYAHGATATAQVWNDANTATAQAYQAQAQATADAATVTARQWADARTATAQAAEATQAARMTADTHALEMTRTVADLRQTDAAITATYAAALVVENQAVATKQALKLAPTGTALALMATATRQAIDAAQDRQDARNAQYWFYLLIVGAGAVLVSLALSIYGMAAAQAEAVQARAERDRADAARLATTVQQHGGIIVVVNALTGDIRTVQALIDGPARLPAVAQPDPVTVVENGAARSLDRLSPEARRVLAFLETARAKTYGSARFIPTDSEMGVGAADWQATVNLLKAADCAVAKSGRPTKGAHGTLIVGRYATLDSLIEAVERGAVDFEPAHAPA